MASEIYSLEFYNGVWLHYIWLTDDLYTYFQGRPRTTIGWLKVMGYWE